MAKPDVTPAQILALVTAVVGLFVSQGAVSNETGKIIIGIAATAVPIVIALADSIIRHGRATGVGAAEVSQPDILGVPSDAVLAEQLDDPDLIDPTPVDEPTPPPAAPGTPPRPQRPGV